MGAEIPREGHVGWGGGMWETGLKVSLMTPRFLSSMALIEVTSPDWVPTPG